jgi:predicted lipoprotein with Yx(FWY)xxD motif
MNGLKIALIVSLVTVGSYGAGMAQMGSTPSDVKISGGMLTDSKGMTLYGFDKDTVPGKSACNSQCLTTWPALPVTSGTMAMGDWTIIDRDDGVKQWAYKGKPLYTFAHDGKAGDINGDGKGGVWHMAMP